MNRGLYETPADKHRRVREQINEHARLLRALGESLVTFADAMEAGDNILGPITGEAIANTLAALPRHIRELFLEHASDEAHAGFLADMRYLSQQSETGTGVS